ncbi:PepSY domain-containing protein [Arcticibacter sp.]|jgi:uncharacterized iron-regulated membrane protein|uniref:PepSY domain-containing protein n=1 Tax=Arcticibacter sp. TaxID=1872630 RepID=UPI00388DC48F
MKLTVLNRKVHSWGSIIIALPLLIVLSSGILLLLKKDISWIQPPTKKGLDTVPSISFDQLLKSVSLVSEAEVVTWKDIKRVDIQPSKGIAKVAVANGYEVQLDTKTSAVLHVAYRRSDIIEALHDGTFFHDKVKYLVSLPTGIILFALLITGVVLFFQPHYVKYKRRRRVFR